MTGKDRQADRGVDGPGSPPVRSEDQRVLAERTQDIRECLGVLMRPRYGPDPEIERFYQGMEGSSD